MTLNDDATPTDFEAARLILRSYEYMTDGDPEGQPRARLFRTAALAELTGDGEHNIEPDVMYTVLGEAAAMNERALVAFAAYAVSELQRLGWVPPPEYKDGTGDYATQMSDGERREAERYMERLRRARHSEDGTDDD